jgi:cbb3-type cytochrome oxidase subunit 1
LPPLTRWFIKASLLDLVLALLIASVLAVQPLMKGLNGLTGLTPVYFHLFLVGWVTQLIFGVVYWMFPKYSTEKPRGRESLGWWTFWLLNIGLGLRVIGEPLNSLQPGGIAGTLLALSALLQWSAGLAFFANTWGRVKEK